MRKLSIYTIISIALFIVNIAFAQPVPMPPVRIAQIGVCTDAAPAQPIPFPFDKIKECAISHSTLEDGCRVSTVLVDKISYFCIYCEADGSIGIAQIDNIGSGAGIGYYPTMKSYDRSVVIKGQIVAIIEIDAESAIRAAQIIYDKMIRLPLGKDA